MQRRDGGGCVCSSVSITHDAGGSACSSVSITHDGGGSACSSVSNTHDGGGSACSSVSNTHDGGGSVCSSVSITHDGGGSACSSVSITHDGGGSVCSSVSDTQQAQSLGVFDSRAVRTRHTQPFPEFLSRPCLQGVEITYKTSVQGLLSTPRRQAAANRTQPMGQLGFALGARTRSYRATKCSAMQLTLGLVAFTVNLFVTTHLLGGHMFERMRHFFATLTQTDVDSQMRGPSERYTGTWSSRTRTRGSRATSTSAGPTGSVQPDSRSQILPDRFTWFAAMRGQMYSVTEQRSVPFLCALWGNSSIFPSRSFNCVGVNFTNSGVNGVHPAR